MSTLADKLRSMKFEFTMQAGHPPTELLLPRDPQTLKAFTEQLVDEIGEAETGSKPWVYHCLMTGEQTMQVYDLNVVVEGDRLGMR